VIRLAKAVLTAYVATDFSHTGKISIGKSGVRTPGGTWAHCLAVAIVFCASDAQKIMIIRDVGTGSFA
tara:strand:+ start:20863 stop:21066 length:204 start_codon:yes stop_codon:yes gene_type:complete